MGLPLIYSAGTTKVLNLTSNIAAFTTFLINGTIIYGAGKMFKTINDNYDLSAINIVGITDQKFKIEEECNNYLGYKIYKI